MDLLTVGEKRADLTAGLASWIPFAGICSYLVVAWAGIAHHEPWADEAQSWLLARDAGLGKLWLQLLHYEGTTGLWQTLLHALIRMGLPYAGTNFVAGLLGAAAAALILWRSPFPLEVRVFLPLAYFLCYQYAVIARSYVLLPVLLFGCAALFEKARERPLLLVFLMCLLSAVSVHGMILAVSIGVAAIVRLHDWRSAGPYASVFAVFAALLAAAAWPVADGTFVSRFNFSFEHLIEVGGRAFASAFTGEAISSLAIVALSIPFLWRGGGLLFFAVAAGLLCGVYAVVYSQVWHFGALFLAWLFALWISYGRMEHQQHWAKNLATSALAVVIAVQCYWTWCAVRFDWDEPYSGSLAAARELRELGLSGHRIYAIGFACVAIEPYFPRNLFANWNSGRPEAYWDWSRRNRVNDDSLHLAESRPDYVIVGYKNDFERDVWMEAIRKSGYHAIRHFEGNSFWQTRRFEPESFELYHWDGDR